MKVVLGKFARLVGAVVIVSFLTFVLTKQLPGDPSLIVLGTGGSAMVPCATAGTAPSSTDGTADCSGISAARLHPRGAKSTGTLQSVCTADQCVLARDKFLHDQRLDQPLLTQYVHWSLAALHGDFGTSYSSNALPVAHLVSQALPPTLEFMFLAEFLALGLAVPLGVWSAYRENRLSDKVTTGVSFALLAFPNFVLAIFLVIVLVVEFGLLPSLFSTWSSGAVANIKSVIIPVVALSAGSLAVFVRLLRSDMIATLQQDFILMARAKGLPPWRILFQHALRPSSFSLLTVAGINLGTLIGGTIIIESMFSTNGIGMLLITAIFTRDYPTIQAVVVLISVVFVVVNVLVDILYSVLDPRIRHA